MEYRSLDVQKSKMEILSGCLLPMPVISHHVPFRGRAHQSVLLILALGVVDILLVKLHLMLIGTKTNGISIKKHIIKGTPIVTH